MLLHSCESISTRLEGTTSTSAECDQISIDHRPRALDGGAEVRESDIQASTDSPNRRRRNTARIDSKPANPLLIPSYAAGCVSQKNSPDLGGTPLTLTEVFGWMCVIPRAGESSTRSGVRLRPSPGVEIADTSAGMRPPIRYSTPSYGSAAIGARPSASIASAAS